MQYQLQKSHIPKFIHKEIIMSKQVHGVTEKELVLPMNVGIRGLQEFYHTALGVRSLSQMDAARVQLCPNDFSALFNRLSYGPEMPLKQCEFECHWVRFCPSYSGKNEGKITLLPAVSVSGDPRAIAA
jgi:hypothetical protein